MQAKAWDGSQKTSTIGPEYYQNGPTTKIDLVMEAVSYHCQENCRIL